MTVDVMAREDELFRRSVHDDLTGLPNRILLTDRISQAFHRARRTGTRLSVFYVDLDGFKAVNDRWGHAIGDQVLKSVSTRLAAALRPADTVARVGGDEFVAVCEGLHGPGDTSEIAQRLIDVVAVPIEHRAGRACLTASVGSASTTTARSRPQTLIDAADRAMYRAKRAGGAAFRTGFCR
jgi:diguanylate cyclase (GGDEF)-like protein